MASVEGFDTIPEIFTCPVCLDLPVNKVFQCRNGHLLCEECYTGQKICPTCRLPFDYEPIRSLVVELLLNGLSFHMNCLYETSGCKMRLDNLASFQDHIKSCRFGPPISICKNLGYPNCSFKMNGGTKVEEVIHHFETLHEAITRDSYRVEVEFTNYAKFFGGSKLLILNQKEKGYAVLFQVTHECQLNFTPLYMRYPTLGHPSGVDSTQHRIVIRSESANPKLAFIDNPPLLDIRSYKDPSLANHPRRSCMNRRILICLKGTSGSFVVSVEVKKVINEALGSAHIPRIMISPSEMKSGYCTNTATLQIPSPSNIFGLYSPTESTVSLKLDKIPDILLCPMCRELPVGSVFQCRKGHILCEECNAKHRYCCPQCLILFDKPPIRSLAVEMLLDELSFKFNCRYEVFGCNLRMDNPKRFRDHIKCCNYRFGRTVNVCKGLGFETCSLQMSPGTTVEEAIRHFETDHGAVTRYTDTIEVEFSDYVNFSGGTKLIILDQEVKGYACLILAKHVSHSPQELQWTPFYMQYPTLGQSITSNMMRPHLMTSSLSVHHETKVQFVYSQPTSDILKSYNLPSLVNLYEMLNMKTLRRSEEPYQSFAVRVCVERFGMENKDCNDIPLITITSSEMIKEEGLNLGVSRMVARTQNPWGKAPPLSPTPAGSPSSCAAGNRNVDTNKRASRDPGSKNTKRSSNSISGCMIV